MNSTKFRDFITNSWKINQLPSPEQLNELLKGALYTLENESLEYRPANDNGKPGSFLSFSTEITLPMQAVYCFYFFFPVLYSYYIDSS